MNILKKMMLCSMIIAGTNSTVIHTRFAESRSYESRDYFCPNKTLMWGSIVFPKTIATVPDIRIYYSGQRIKCEINHDLKRVTYAIPDVANKYQFKLLITDNLEFAAEYNVIKYLKVRENAAYKFYLVEITRPNNNCCSFEQQYETDPSCTKHKAEWHIKEYHNAFNKGRIPDDTIIICCNPAYIECIEGKNATTLPTIKIRQDIIQFAGSEKKLHEISDELIISLLDYDTIHAAMHQEEIRPSTNPKTILSITT